MPRAPRRAGRPRHFDADALREVWLYVAIRVARTGLTPHQVCLHGELFWGVGGARLDKPANRKTGRLIIKHSISGNTLWRRFEEAQALLRSELGLAQFWLSVLALRLAESDEKNPPQA